MSPIASSPITQALAAALTLTLVALLLAFTFVFTAVDRDALAETVPAVAAAVPVAQEATPLASVNEMPEFADEGVREDVLWLARVIYSETKRPDEQELVAWVIRNRVETGYRGAKTYKDAVLDPWQFSAFNQNAPKRAHYSGLDEGSTAKGWVTAVHIAHEVVTAPAYDRPFDTETRHFYSEQSMVGRSHPAWAAGKRPVSLDREVDPRRFRFYSAIS